MQNKIRELLAEYRKSGIQSESEIRTKFVIPFLSILGYPSELRAEEFSVYGYAGREKLKAKKADFIIFKDKDFGKHNTDTLKNRQWVQENSILIVETKKPYLFTEDLGQAQFYTMWTKALAYIVTDGEKIGIYFYNSINKDFELLNTDVDSLVNVENVTKLKNITYEKLLYLKGKNDINNYQKNIPKGVTVVTKEDLDLLDKNTVLNLPKKVKDGFKKALGKNADGLTEVQLLSKFLGMTDAYLENDIRYGIPEYMLNIPRSVKEAALYIGDNVFPLVKGEVTEYYRNDVNIFEFDSPIITIKLLYFEENLYSYSYGYKIQDSSVDIRINKLNTIKKIFLSERVLITVGKSQDGLKTLNLKGNNNCWIDRDKDTVLLDYWISGMEMLKRIEEYYEITFSLRKINDNKKKLEETYVAILYVYNGIVHEKNCTLRIPAPKGVPKGSYEITDPILIGEGKDILLPKRVIHGITFVPSKCVVLPCEFKLKKSGTERFAVVPGCCEYAIEF
jgi:hypothetical protein